MTNKKYMEILNNLQEELCNNRKLLTELIKYREDPLIIEEMFRIIRAKEIITTHIRNEILK